MSAGYFEGMKNLGGSLEGKKKKRRNTHTRFRESEQVRREKKKRKLRREKRKTMRGEDRKKKKGKKKGKKEKQHAHPPAPMVPLRAKLRRRTDETSIFPRTTTRRRGKGELLVRCCIFGLVLWVGCLGFVLWGIWGFVPQPAKKERN
jgi:hypothetical protein